MLKIIQYMEKPEEEDLKLRLKKAREKLAGQQMLLKDHKVPVLVLVEGWGTAKILTQGFLRWRLWTGPVKRNRENLFCADILAKYRKLGSSCFWIPGGWMN